MCLNVIRCSVEMGNFLHVANYVNKAEATPEAKVRKRASAMLPAAGL
jgi:COP9 signalosome complex subunit 1